MSVEMTPTHIATVRPDHTIALPAEMPVGAKVMVIVMPDESARAQEAARRERFAKTLEAIRAAMQMPPAQATDSEIDSLVDKARKSVASL
jgi:hypothetical protein